MHGAHSSRQAWLFVMVDGQQSSPVQIFPTYGYLVGPAGRRESYGLSELRLIDADSGRMLFVGVAGDEVETLLSAPYAVRRTEAVAAR